MRSLCPPTHSRSISKSAKLTKQLQKNYQLYILIIPAVVAVFIFSYIPMYGVQIAFRDFNMRKGMWASNWVGLKHFIRFVSSSNFWPLLRNTLGISTYSLVAGFPLPILLAFMLNEVRHVYFKKTVQMITYMPHFISTVVVCSMIIMFTDRSKGVINLVLNALGAESVAFITIPEYFSTIYVLSGIWQGIGWGTIIYLAALSAMDMNMLEAATIDGASRMQQIIHIKFPSILPTIITLLILRIGSLISVGYEKILLLQNDLNMEASDVISTYVYRLGILDAQYSFTAAIGLFNSLANIILLVSFNALAKRLGETSLW